MEDWKEAKRSNESWPKTMNRKERKKKPTDSQSRGRKGRAKQPREHKKVIIRHVLPLAEEPCSKAQVEREVQRGEPLGAGVVVFVGGVVGFRKRGGVE